jgi:hypothetical protein
MSKRFGHSKPGGPFLKTLSNYADEQFLQIDQKFQTVLYFYTRKPEYETSTIYDTLTNRKMSMSKLVPNPISQPRAPNIPYFEPVSNRRSMPDPTTISSDQAAPPTTTATTTSSLTTPAPTAPTQEPPPATTPSTTSSATTTSPPGSLDFSEFAGVTDSPDSREKRSVYPTINPDPYDQFKITPYQPPIGSPTRSKRFVGTLIASLLASIGIGSIFGAIDSAQINSIKEGVKSTAGKQALIIHELEQDSKHIITNRNMISGLEDLTIRIGKYTKIHHFETNGMLLFVLMQSEYSRVHLALDQIVDIVEASQHHKFHPGVLSQEGANSAFDEIKGLAEVRGLTPVIRTAQQLSQLQTNFYMTPTGITLVVDIPLASEQTTFTLHRYNALPIKLGEEVFAKLVPSNPILAIGESEPSGSPRYVEMSSTDLSMCQRLGKIYLCTDQRIVKRPNQYSCLYSLFVGDHKAARQVCQLTLEAKKYDQVVSTSSDSFLHYSVNPSTFIYKCQNNSITRGHQLAEITEIQIPRSCRVETSNFILYRQNDLYKKASPKSYQWTLPPLTFLSNDTSIVDLNSAVKAVEKLKGAPPITTETIEKLKRLNKPFYLHTFPVINFLIAISGLLLVLAMISLVTYRACQSKRINRMQRDPVYRFKELLKDEGNLELLEQLLQQRSKN